MTDTIAELRERHLAMADKAIADDSDHLDVPGPNDMAWLIAQLACWPTRVDPSCTTNSRFLMVSAAHSLRSLLDRVEAGEWRPIETAPKDGATIDVWRDGSRETVYWGFPPHECGEMGQYCDSDWHSVKKPGWICSTFGEFVGGKHDPFTHWRPLPEAPQQKADTP